MNPLLKKLIAELKEKHGADLDLVNEHYSLICSDGIFSVYLDEEEKELKVNIELIDAPKCYFSDLSITELMEQK